MNLRSLRALLVVLLAGCSDVASSDPVVNSTDLVAGITTQVADAYAYAGKPATEPTFPIATSVKAVTYSKPVKIVRGPLTYWETTGTIRGVGWGGFAELLDDTGASLFVGLNDAHYDYEVSFVLRWNVKWNGVLDAYHHGGWSFSGLKSAKDSSGAAGVADVTALEHEGDGLVSDAVLSDERKHAYFAINSLLKKDGTPAAIANEGLYKGRPISFPGDSPIGRDTTQVAQRLLAKLAGKPVVMTLGLGHSFGAIRMRNLNFGNATFMNRYARVSLSFTRTSSGAAGVIPGGTPVSTVADADGSQITFLTIADLPIAAGDNGPFTVLAEATYADASTNVPAQTLTSVTDLFDDTLVVNNAQAATGGSDLPARAGDVHVTAYDKTSPKIYDGMLLFALGCAAVPDPTAVRSCHIDPTSPLELPMTLVRGELEGQLDDLRLASQLQDSGVDLPTWLRIYEVRNLPHDWDEIWHGTPHVAAALSQLGLGEIAQAGKMTPVVAELIDDMTAHLQKGTMRAPSRIDGAIAMVTDASGTHEAVVFQQTHRRPDSDHGVEQTSSLPFVDDPTIDVIAPELQGDTAAYVAMYKAVTASLPHTAEAIVLPETACRAGSLTMVMDDDSDAWFTAFSDQSTLWSAADYQACVDQAAQKLATAGLYDRTIANRAPLP